LGWFRDSSSFKITENHSFSVDDLEMTFFLLDVNHLNNPAECMGLEDFNEINRPFRQNNYLSSPRMKRRIEIGPNDIFPS